MVTLLLADDHRVVRQGLRALLTALADVRLVGEAGDGLEAARLAERLRPDVLLADLRMPGLDGLEVARRVARSCPGTRVVILSMYADVGYVRAALRAGVAGYVLKESGLDELARAIRAAADGERYVSPSLRGEEAAARERQAEGEAADSYEALTEREREVLRLTAEGCSGGEVAERLFISPRTVESHRASLMRKLGVRNQKELIRYAVQRERRIGGEGEPGRAPPGRRE
jgi:DNA-binding NarL/FixJ family response regulator